MSRIVSGSRMKNFFLNDTFMDFLEKYPHRIASALLGSDEIAKPMLYKKKVNKMISSNTDPEDKFLLYLCGRGNKFENDIMKNIIAKFGNEVVTISSDRKNFDEWSRKTKESILSGIPIIYQGYVECNEKYRGGHGFPDLIVRSDYINKLVSYNHLSGEESALAAPKLKNSYHYRIIDIKSSKLNLCSDGLRIRNSHLYPAYKGQITMYNQGLAEIQGYLPMTGYIMGNGYQYESRGELHSSDDSFEKMGEIKLDGWDKGYIDEVETAVEWYRNLEEGENWDLDQPELYPNMSNKFPSPFNPLKRKYADHIGELTMLWNVGVKHRKIAHSKGIKSWRDKKCSSTILGIDGKRTDLLDKIIKFQNQDKLWNINPARSDCLPYSKQPLELFVDFETIQPPLIEDLFIYMIGVYVKGDKIDQFKVFTAVDKNDQFGVINRFFNYVSELSNELPRMYHWHHVERTVMAKVLDRLYLSHPAEVSVMRRKFNWFDLLDALRKDHLVIKGCFGYGLKEVTNALHRNGLIDIEWPEGCSSGEEAMLTGYLHLYEKEDPKAIKEAEEYNEIDCRAMYQVLEAVRKNININ